MKVNLLLIGAGRSGTTTLYEHLKQHPEICFSNMKEIPYFSVEDIYTRGDLYYHSFFKCTEKKVIASSDTYLLIDKEAPNRIVQYNPDMKLIVLLREPVERAYSSYIYALNNGHEKNNVSFKDSFEKEQENINQKNIITQNNLGHFYTGLYYKHISYWMQFFPKENFLLLKTEDLKNNYQEVLKSVCTFLGISEFKESTDIKTNQASGAKCMFIHQFFINRDQVFRKILRKIIPDSIKKRVFNSGLIEKIVHINRKQNSYPKLTEEERNIVSNYFVEDSEKLKQEYNITF